MRTATVLSQLPLSASLLIIVFSATAKILRSILGLPAPAEKRPLSPLLSLVGLVWTQLVLFWLAIDKAGHSKGRQGATFALSKQDQQGIAPA